MPFDGSGNFNRVMNWVNDAAASVKIRSDRHDQEDNNFAAGLSQCITKNGETQVIADIPMNGRRVTNMGTPVNAQDAATKDYVDSIRSFTTSLSISGADANGRLNFSSPTGVNGISWSSVNMCWVARPADASQQQARVVLNNSVDGSGTDVIRADRSGNFSAVNYVGPNTAFDGTSWRTIAAGYAGYMQLASSSAFLWGHDTATTAAWQTVTPRNYMQLAGNGGMSQILMNFNGSGKGAWIYGRNGTSTRWLLALGNGGAETGSNAGSDFSIGRYNDSGGSIGAALTIFRNTGIVNLSSGLQAGYGQQGRMGNTGGYLTTWHNWQWAGGLYAWVDSSQIGLVSITCDYRIKKDVKPLVRTWNLVKQLRPISYTTKDYAQGDTQLSADSDEPQWGFLAHELQETLLKSAATGEKDAENVLQSPNLMAVVAALTSALQEAQVRIEALEAKLA
jgi:hypothetical protein